MTRVRRSSPNPYNQTFPSYPPRLLSALPGLRLVAQHRWGAGLPYVVLGLLTVVFFIVVLTDIPARNRLIARHNLNESYILFDSAALFTLVLLYELLRLSAEFKEYKPITPKAPRIIAAAFWPSLSIVVMGFSALTTPWTETAQAIWLCSLFLLTGTIPAVGLLHSEATVYRCHVHRTDHSSNNDQ